MRRNSRRGPADSPTSAPNTGGKRQRDFAQAPCRAPPGSRTLSYIFSRIVMSPQMWEPRAVQGMKSQHSEVRF